eukprot:gene9481-12772_t
MNICMVIYPKSNLNFHRRSSIRYDPYTNKYYAMNDKTNDLNNNDNDSSKTPDNSSIDELNLKFTKAADYIKVLAEDKKLRDEKVKGLFSKMWIILKNGFNNTFRDPKSGVMGQRGENWVAGQFLLLSFIFLGIHPLLSITIKLSGLILFLLGGFMTISGVFTLLENISPFITPSSTNQLVTNSGLYQYIRHPMYAGLILFSIGISILNDSVDKAILSILLAILLDKKSDLEETFLIQKHNETANSLMFQVRLQPFSTVVQPLPSEFHWIKSILLSYYHMKSGWIPVETVGVEYEINGLQLKLTVFQNVIMRRREKFIPFLY